MQPIDIVIIVLISTAVLAVVGHGAWKKIKGRGGGCSGCPHAVACKGGCAVKSKEEKKNNEETV